MDGFAGNDVSLDWRDARNQKLQIRNRDIFNQCAEVPKKIS